MAEAGECGEPSPGLGPSGVGGGPGLGFFGRGAGEAGG